MPAKRAGLNESQNPEGGTESEMERFRIRKPTKVGMAAHAVLDKLQLPDFDNYEYGTGFELAFAKQGWLAWVEFLSQNIYDHACPDYARVSMFGALCQYMTVRLVPVRVAYVLDLVGTLVKHTVCGLFGHKVVNEQRGGRYYEEPVVSYCSRCGWYEA